MEEPPDFIWGLGKVFEHHLCPLYAFLIPLQREIKPPCLWRVLGSSLPRAPPP